MSTLVEPTGTSTTAAAGDHRPAPRRQRPPRPNTGDANGLNVEGGAGQSVRGDGRGGERRGGSRGQKGRGGATDGGRRDGRADGAPSASSSVVGEGPKRPPRTRTRRPKGDGQDRAPPAEGSAKAPIDVKPAQPKNSRRAKFNAKLTDESNAAGPDARREKEPRPPPSERYRNLLGKDDLTSRLIDELSTPPYTDCPICFAAIHPAQPTYSCSPLIPVSVATDGSTGAPTSQPAETAQCCWTTFHLKCIRSWASKSVRDLEEAWRARGEERKGEWRCPGCQAKRETVPAVYWCFCGSTPDPKPPRLAMPHSCASPCTRPRACGHPCPLSCHPGPCPPCQITTQTPCFCGKQVLSFRCANLAPGRAGHSPMRSCNNVCGKKLNCGNHTCESTCHDGPCAPCTVREPAMCYCGKTEKELGCGIGEEKMSVVIEDDMSRSWIGRFQCQSTCERPFDCGIHRCEQPCHVPSPVPEPCPRSPSVVKTCPCGKHTLESSSAPFFPPNTTLSRSACTDPVPTCKSTCMKPLEGCHHKCSVKCHTGPCPPCSIVIVRPCRCGLTTRNVRCAEDQKRARGEVEEILCERPCPALRACGRHECRRPCCPLASMANNTKGKGKKKMVAQDTDGLMDEAGWHQCDLVCGKTLSCGNHTCEERDHRDACPPCLQSSFEEMVCHCGRTVLEPPIPCGTRINCRYPCNRPLLPCGHPKTQHACHEDPTPCPPCVVLTTKQCACGKKEVGNVKCSLAREKVSCGTVCGRLLSCGFHHCDRLCHSDGCGTCHAVCGKSRKLCFPAHHPCTTACHAPAACSETEPCRAAIMITCPCGRIRQSVPCGRSASNPAGQEGSQQLKCSTECQIAKRNARLAEALGISGESRLTQASYTDELTGFARANIKFCQLVEKTFADFVNSDKKSQILPHMPESRRKFVHDLAAVYRLDTRLVDQEPHRSVQLFKRLDTRVPSPVLSASVSPQAPISSLGKLADLRAPVARPAAGSSRLTPSGPTPPHTPRGWTSVVTRPTSGQANSSTNPAAWLLSNTGGASNSASASAPRSRPLSAAATQPPPPVAAPRPSGEEVPDNWEDEA